MCMIQLANCKILTLFHIFVLLLAKPFKTEIPDKHSLTCMMEITNCWNLTLYDIFTLPLVQRNLMKRSLKSAL